MVTTHGIHVPCPQQVPRKGAGAHSDVQKAGVLASTEEGIRQPSFTATELIPSVNFSPVVRWTIPAVTLSGTAQRDLCSPLHVVLAPQGSVGSALTAVD